MDGNTLERRPWLVPLLLALLCVVFFRNVLLPEPGYGTLTGGDLLNFNYPRLSFVVRAIRSGQFPLWNPYVYGGVPATVNPQLGLYYPPNVLLLVAGAVRGATLLLVLHVWWGAWGMAKLARNFGASALGGLLAGVTFGFSSLMIANLWAGHYTRVMVLAWGPWVLAAYRHALQRGTWQAALPGAAALALTLLTGHLPMSVYVALLLVAVWAFHLAEAVSGGGPFLPALRLASRQLAIVGAGGGLLAAVQLLPTAAFIPFSTRASGSGLEFAASYALPGAQLLTVLLPNLLGNPNLEQWGYWGGPNYEELNAFAGLWAIFAALLALRLRRNAARFYWALGLLGLVLSLGLRGGLLILLHRWTPLVGFLRAPGRALYLVVIALAGLSGLALTYLQSASVQERRELLRPALRAWVPGAAILVFGGTFILLALWSLAPAETAYGRLWHMANAAAESGLMIGLAGFSLWLWSQDGPHAAGWAALATLVVVVVDLWRVGLPLVVVGRVDEAVHPVWREIEAAIPAHDPTFRLMTVREPYWDTLTANGAMVSGHYNTYGADATEMASYVRFRELSGDPMANNNRLWGVRYVLTQGTYKEAGFDHPSEARLVAEGTQNIYEVEGGLRAFVAREYVVEPDDDAAFDRLMAADFDPARTVILDSKPACPVSGEGGTATFDEYTLNRVTLDVEADGPGLLVLSDQWYPGWTATVDDQSVEVLRAYTIFRAVCVPGGEHVVTFRFRPMIWRVGAGLSLAGWSALLMLGIGGLLRCHRPTRLDGGGSG